MKLKNVVKICNKNTLCFSVKSFDEVMFDGWVQYKTCKIKIIPVFNNNMHDLDNALYELIEVDGDNPENFIGKEFCECL